MNGISTYAKRDLEPMFGDRLRFRLTERKLYGHDIAAMPGMVKPLVGNTVPDAVVQPETEAELVRLMGKIPGALGMMKPMFPILFPRLLPMMMPKLLPTMLKRVAVIVPMPDYMREQMPDLMPKVMDNLMPHMIGDVVPLVTQPMIDYLQGKQKPPATAPLAA